MIVHHINTHYDKKDGWKAWERNNTMLMGYGKTENDAIEDLHTQIEFEEWAMKEEEQ